MVGNVGNAAEILGRNLAERCKNGHHGVVDPDVDRAEFAFGALGGGIDLGIVAGIGRDRDGLRTQRLGLCPRRLEALGLAGEQGDARTATREFAHCCPPDTRAGAGDHDNFPILDRHGFLRRRLLKKA